MGVFDLLVIGVGCVGYALGRARGLAWQVSGILTLLVGGAAATALCRPVGALFTDGILGRFVGWIAVYAIVATALYVLTLSFREKLKEIEFDELDKRFGGVLGAIKALAVLAVITLVAVPLSPRVARAVKRTPSGRALAKVVEELEGLLPERIPETFAAPVSEAPGADAEADAEPEPAAPPVHRPTQREPAPTPAPAPAPTTPRLPDPSYGRTPPILPPQRALPEDDGLGEDHVERDLTGPDPFDTQGDPVDPLAPPRK
ncbi:MAG: CvpA family protein [Planctomycetota bacterium]